MANGGKNGKAEAVSVAPGPFTLRALFTVYAPDKAKTTRWILGVCAFALLAFGAYGLYYSFGETMRAPIGGWRPLGDELSLLFALAGWAGAWWGVNHPRFVEFFHDTEVELTKVSWSSKNEVLGSSAVVMVVTVVLGVWIFVLDKGYDILLRMLGY